MKSLTEHLKAVEVESHRPQQGDVFDFEIQNSELVESYVIESRGNTIVVAGDQHLLKMLSDAGCLFETIGRYGAVGKSMGTGFVVDDANSNDPLLAKSMDDMAVSAMEDVQDSVKTELSNIAATQDYNKIYDLLTSSSETGQYLQNLYDEIGFENMLHGDDDYDEIVELVMDRLIDDFGELDEQEMTEAEYQGRDVPVGKPMQGDVKKFKVYVKDPSTGNVKKVNFGDPDMRIKKSNPERRKSFRARHRCDNPGPRTKARYWSCRMW